MRDEIVLHQSLVSRKIQIKYPIFPILTTKQIVAYKSEIEKLRKMKYNALSTNLRHSISVSFHSHVQRCGFCEIIHNRTIAYRELTQLHYSDRGCACTMSDFVWYGLELRVDFVQFYNASVQHAMSYFEMDKNLRSILDVFYTAAHWSLLPNV